jgi:anti-sigma regulatory factor (Ser/Thr protein kinase)
MKDIGCASDPVDARNGGDPRMPQADTDVLREAFDLSSRAASAAEARHRTLAWLFHHAVGRQAAEAAVLIVSEFVANAVVHSGGDVISCALRLGDGLLRIEVTDQGGGLAEPAAQEPAADEISGRGLLMVGAVSEAWGVSPAVAGGRTVWATLRAAE